MLAYLVETMWHFRKHSTAYICTHCHLLERDIKINVKKSLYLVENTRPQTIIFLNALILMHLKKKLIYAVVTLVRDNILK